MHVLIMQKVSVFYANVLQYKPRRKQFLKFSNKLFKAGGRGTAGPTDFSNSLQETQKYELINEYIVKIKGELSSEQSML